ncbi:ABC transporter ATP-binding protein [Actinomadura sp. 1N219]|uniref:ABC transporter ATP-binding protein n=1 Tax=Actinomadura sp. 1N219 TaxID=3375152 RepID=UPI0037B42840
MLRLDQVTAGYDGVPVVGPITLDVTAGGVTVLLGANGAGKTTTLDAAAGLIPVMSGSIEFDGRPVTRLSAPRRARAGMCYALEGHRIFPEMTVQENLRLAASGQRRASRAVWDECFELFPILAERGEQRAGLLSGGEQQMLALGRALLGDPKVLILDEPSLGLAPKIIDQVYGAIRRLTGSGRTILLSEQNVGHALEIATSVNILERGSLAFTGPPDRLRDDDRLKAAYLG